MMAVFTSLRTQRESLWGRVKQSHLVDTVETASRQHALPMLGARNDDLTFGVLACFGRPRPKVGISRHTSSKTLEAGKGVLSGQTNILCDKIIVRPLEGLCCG